MAPPRHNLGSLLDDLGRDPGREAFVLRTPYRSFRWSAGRVRATALHLARRLEHEGIEPRDRVILQGPNSPLWCAAFLGIVARGSVPVPVDETAPVEFSRRVAERVGARGVLASPATVEALRAGPRLVERLEELAPADEPPPGVTPYRAAGDETAQIVFTSGTTAEPRGVVLTHDNLLSTLVRIENGFRKREWYLRPLLPMRFLCLVPLSHLFGQSLGLVLPVLMRSTGVFVPSLQSGRIVKAIRSEHPLAVITVPRTLAGLRDAVEREMERRGRLGRFRHGLERAEGRAAWRRILLTRSIRSVLGWRTWAIVVGGAPLEADLESFWSRSGFAVIEGYGITEAAPIVAVRNPLDGKLHSLGKPVGGIEVRLAEDGEILVRGPNVMQGYLGDNASTREVLREGWLRTGDIAEADADGRLYYRGRKKEVIVTASGMNVFPADVEKVLDRLPGVRESVVFAVPSPTSGGDEVHAAVLPEEPARDAEQLRSAANERLGAHQRVRRVWLWAGSDFPRTSTGKVRRAEISEAVRRGRTPRPTGGAGPATPTARLLRRLRADLGPVHPGDRLAEDLGLESLEMVELLGLMEEELGVSIDDRRVGASMTVADLERLAGRGSPERMRLTMPRWSRRAPARVTRAVLRTALIRPLFHGFVRLRVEGRERLQGLESPLLIVANHTSMLDVPAVLVALPRGLRGRLAPAMAIEALREHVEPNGQPRLRRWRSALFYNLAILLFNAYPMPQTRAFRPSLEYTGELLDAGRCPLVFPEGRMSPTGEMLPFLAGIGLLAARTRARVLPVRLEGLRRILPPGGRWPVRGKARVVLGEPFDPLAGGGDDAGAVAARIEAAVREAGTRRARPGP